MLDGTVDGYESYEAAVDAQSAEPLADRIAGSDMLYSSGTTGLPKGVTKAFVARAVGDVPVRRHGRAAAAVRRQRVVGVPLPRADVPRRTAALLDEHHRPRRHRRRDGAVRRRAVPGTRRAPPRHPQPGRPDDVRAPAQAPGRRAGPLRRVVAGVRDPRRRAVPGAGEAGDDRVVRAGDPRVLRGDRGQRLRVLQQRAVAGPPGHRSVPPSAA